MGYMSFTAKILNKRPKLESKSHKEKEEKWNKMMENRVVCEKCKKNTTLYNIKGHYFCAECKDKKKGRKKKCVEGKKD